MTPSEGDFHPDLSAALTGNAAQSFNPWEQRAAPGMGSHWPAPARDLPTEEVAHLPQFCQELGRQGLADVIEQQTDLIHYPLLDRQSTPETDLSVRAESNTEVWQRFLTEELFDTRRVALEHFHLFEWFPLSPGKYHTPDARDYRDEARQQMELAPDGRTYFNPLGKMQMIRGGIGAVRLRPRQLAGEAYYFMTASSTGVCHTGFPVLVPRRFYAPLKMRMLAEGAVPVTLSGEMRYIPQDAVTFFSGQREIPLLYLHVDELRILPRPRSAVTAYLINVAISFQGEFAGVAGTYAAYAAFDPAERGALQQATNWLRDTYVGAAHAGTVITDFDEIRPRFPHALFGLPTLLRGQVARAQIQAWLQARGFTAEVGAGFFNIINTGGGAYIAGNVYTEGGDFIGRDQIISSPSPS